MSRKKKRNASSQTQTPDTGKSSRAGKASPRPGMNGGGVGICALLFLAVLAVFGRSVSFEFLDFDDIRNVSQNPFVSGGLTPGNFVWAFSHTQVGDWIPLTTLSHMACSQLFGLWAGGHHLVNVLLHGAVGVLLLLVLRDMTGSLWRSAAVAALFALHPLRAESVAWISERKDVLSALFFMLTLRAYVRWTRRSGRGWVGPWVWIFLALGLLCKTMLVTTPVVLLLLDVWPLQRSAQASFRQRVMEKAPLFLLSAAAATGQLLASHGGMVSAEGHPLTTRLANAVVSCATYIVQMFWPANLAGFYPYPRHGISPASICGAVVLLVVISAAAYRWRRQAPWLAVGWLWYLVMLAPVLGLIQAGEISHADRYTYLPQIGLYLAVVWAVGSWCANHAGHHVLAGSAAAVMVLTLSVLAYRQTGFWRDSETMWSRALACTTDNDTAHYNLGTRLLGSGRSEEARAHFEKALEANPGYADAHINLGRICLQQGMLDEAAAHYWKALEIKPLLAEAHYNLGILSMRKGAPDEAIAHYQKAIEINPAYFDAHNNLGSALLSTGHPGEAITQYETALRLNPDSAATHNNLAAALVQKGSDAAAGQHLRRALELEPNHVKALNGLAWLLSTSSDASIRDGANAVKFAEQANRLTGDNNPVLMRTLAAAYAEAGRFDEALRKAQHALDLAAKEPGAKQANLLRSDIESYQSAKPLR